MTSNSNGHRAVPLISIILIGLLMFLTSLCSCSSTREQPISYVYQEYCGSVVSTKVIIEDTFFKHGSTQLQTDQEIIMLVGEQDHITIGAMVHCRRKLPDADSAYTVTCTIEGKEYNIRRL